MDRPARTYRLAPGAVGWVVAARAALAFLPYRVARRWMDVRLEPMRDRVGPREIAWAIQAVSRRIPGTHCLARSLALNAMLRSTGHASEVRIGVARSSTGALDAHAWVVCGGQALPDEDLGRYATFG